MREADLYFILPGTSGLGLKGRKEGAFSCAEPFTGSSGPEGRRHRTGAVSVADEVNNLLSVEYRWGEGQEWNPTGIGENTVQTYTFTKDVTSLEDGVAHTGTLYVRTTDIEGNTSESTVSYSYDLTKPAYSYRLEAPGNYPL